MTPKEIHSVIQKAVDACQKKDAEAFTALFAEEGEIIISQQPIIGKAAVREITATYLLSCGSIEITMEEIVIEGDRAIVKWFWAESQVTGEPKSNHNTIKIDFESGLIIRWQEFVTKKP
ncbi:MAG: nuclear transport factor 2 family protein [Spirulinaceae cyanobacterium]